MTTLSNVGYKRKAEKAEKKRKSGRFEKCQRIKPATRAVDVFTEREPK